MKKLGITFLSILLAGTVFAADILMDTQVVDVRSIGTNVVLASKSPASTYFVVNKIMSKSVGSAKLTSVLLRLTTATGVEYTVPATTVNTSTATNLFVVTPTVPIEVHGADYLTVTGITNANYRISYDIVSRGMPKNEGLTVTR
jgi:hypothetical protein